MIPPQDLDAEKQVIGSILLDNSVINDFNLKPSEFYLPAGCLIYEHMQKLAKDKKPIDPITLKNSMGFSFEEVQDYLMQCIQEVTTSTNAKHYAQIVSEKNVKRKIIKSGQEIVNKTYEDKELNEIYSEIKNMYSIEINSGDQGFRSASDVMIDWEKQLEEKTKGVCGIKTGFYDLDKNVGSLMDGEMVILAARPGMGKTALALQIGLSNSKNNCVVPFFALEMQEVSLVNRLVSSEMNILAKKLRTGQIDKNDIYTMKSRREEFMEAVKNIMICDKAKITTDEMRSKLHQLSKKKNIGLIIVDYLQLIQGNGRGRTESITDISRDLKIIAKEFKCPLIALSQLSRKVEERDPAIPKLSDLRDSGAIEQDADFVWFIYREEYYNKDSQRKGEADIIVAKGRETNTGMVKVGFDSTHVRFVNLEWQR